MVKGEKKGAKKASASAAIGRVRKLSRSQNKQVAKKKVRKRKLPGSFRLLGQAFSIFKSYWRPLGGIVLVYLILNIIFASGISSLTSTVSSIKDNFQASSGHHFLDALGGFSSLVGSAGAGSSQTAS